MPAASRCLSEQAFVPMSTAVFAVVAGSMALPAADAGILFADSFRYANGNLAGNAGGSGWAVGSAWAGGAGADGNLVSAPLVVNPDDATARSIRFSSNASTTTRSLSTRYTTGGGSYYVSFVFNASPYSAPNSGAYAGFTLFDSADRSSNSLFLGMPGSSGQLGFDWTQRGDGLYAAASATNYLVLCAITTEAASTTTVRMYATTDLTMTGSALATPAMQIASMLNEPMFSFNSVEIAGAYNTGTINFAGLAMADNATDAVTFTQNAVPGPGAMLVLALAARFGAGPGSARRRASTIAGG